MKDPLPGFSPPMAFYDALNIPSDTSPLFTTTSHDNILETIIQSTNIPPSPTQLPILEENTTEIFNNPPVRRSTRATKQPSYLQAYHCNLLESQSHTKILQNIL